jgi:hypothetical protein
MTLQRNTPLKRTPTKNRPKTREGLCECGCGQVTEVWAVTQRYRGRVRGEHKRFVRGHNIRKPGVDYETRFYCSSCGVEIGRKGTTGLCRVCCMREVGKLGVVEKSDCAHCGEPCPTPEQRYCSRACYLVGHEVPKGAAHHSWKGDEVGEWGARGRAQKAIETLPCEECGDPKVHRHHVDRNIHNNDLSNIRFLCASHHRKLHYREDGPKGARHGR